MDPGEGAALCMRAYIGICGSVHLMPALVTGPALYGRPAIVQ